MEKTRTNPSILLYFSYVQMIYHSLFQYPIEEIDPDHSPSELTHRDIIPKDPDERFREALQKLRTDRAKQQKELVK